MTDPCVADTSSHPYQYATEIDIRNGDFTANDGLDDLFEPIEGDFDLGTNLEGPNEEEFMKNLLEYTTARGPGPTHEDNHDWDQNMKTPTRSAHKYTPEPQVLADSPLPTVEFSPPLNSGITTTINKSATHSLAGPSTSPATPRSNSRIAEALENSCTPPSLKVPKASLVAGLLPRGVEAADLNLSDGDSVESATEFLEPESIRKKTPRQKTPARQSLGSPFAPAIAPARRATAAMMEMFGSSLQPGSGNLVNNMHMPSPLPQGQNAIYQNHMQGGMGPRYHSAPVNFSSPPNPATFTTKMQNNTLLQARPQMQQQTPTKRQQMGSVGAQQVPTTAQSQQETQRRNFMQTRMGPGSMNPQVTPSPQRGNVQNWIGNMSNSGSPSQSTMPQSNGFDFPVPKPSGSLGGIKQEYEGNVNTGQKRNASQMMRGDMNTGNFLCSPGHMNQGLDLDGADLGNLNVPGNQLQDTQEIQRRAQMAYYSQMQQSALGMQSPGHTSSPGHLFSPMQMQAAGPGSSPKSGTISEDDDDACSASRPDFSGFASSADAQCTAATDATSFTGQPSVIP